MLIVNSNVMVTFSPHSDVRQDIQFTLILLLTLFYLSMAPGLVQTFQETENMAGDVQEL